MKDTLLQEYRAQLFTPQSTVSITNSDYTALQAEVISILAHHAIKPKWDNENSDSTIFINDQQGNAVGFIVKHDVTPELSVRTLVSTRRMTQRAA